MSPGSAEIAAEAKRLCAVIDTNALPLRTAQLGKRFDLLDASFRLHTRSRNTIYRVSGRYEWFLKLPRTGDARAIVHERLGTDVIGGALQARPEYGGPAMIRVSTDPAYVLAAAIPGTPLNRVLWTESWVPTASAARRLEERLATLGTLLATLHVQGRIRAGMPAATTRPFEVVDTILGGLNGRDRLVDAIAAWHAAHPQSDADLTFIHGNLRFDNVLSLDNRLGFIDFENCGTGSPYVDLSRPITDLLLTRCLVAFPRARMDRCITAFLGAYRRMRACDPMQLWEYIGARIARYALENRAGRLVPGTLGGLPVLRHRLDHLTVAALQPSFEAVVPEIGL